MGIRKEAEHEQWLAALRNNVVFVGSFYLPAAQECSLQSASKFMPRIIPYEGIGVKLRKKLYSKVIYTYALGTISTSRLAFKCEGNENLKLSRRRVALIFQFRVGKSKLPPVGHPAWHTSGPGKATFYESRQTTEISDNQSAVTVYHRRRDNDENWLLQIH
ncbi:hypothetical protein V1477_020296 [Vespula maculifrons]|uniref:PH domain-containing protein n=1 Tax=Vespula maculifrons TaxID=7453 RepID=A0ABD2AM53_VESMC